MSGSGFAHQAFYVIFLMFSRAAFPFSERCRLPSKAEYWNEAAGV
jgi:hypothetical protein